ncbi:MAG: hypothetical protein IV107_25150 [Paucibacter sp.]|nr:hypothetical protein [Roseateles sp.]
MIEKFVFRLLLTLSCLAFAAASFAADSYIGGTIVDTTSIPAGLMIRLDTGMPTNCANSPHGWMLIKSEHKAMLTLAMLMIATGKKGVVVYTNGVGSSGFCEIGQFDPFEM